MPAVIGTVIERIFDVIYMLLKTDAELLATMPPDMEPPDPQLYNPEMHRDRATEAYVPAKQRLKPACVVCLPKSLEQQQGRPRGTRQPSHTMAISAGERSARVTRWPRSASQRL